MCGRFTSLLSPELLAVIYGVQAKLSTADPRYNIAPTQPVMIVRQQPDGKRELAQVKWGLIPSWSKDPAIGNSLINARCETVAEKPSFRAAFKHRRCIVPASGYFEWQKTGEKSKQPWYITSVDGAPLSFAGLWEHWPSPDGSEVETCTILTTTANELTMPIHVRMPVILQSSDVDLWLDQKIQSPAELQRLYQPYPAEKLQQWPVSTFVNSPAHNSEECIHRVHL